MLNYDKYVLLNLFNYYSIISKQLATLNTSYLISKKQQYSKILINNCIIQIN